MLPKNAKSVTHGRKKGIVYSIWHSVHDGANAIALRDIANVKGGYEI
jgi:hypothetical protein